MTETETGMQTETGGPETRDRDHPPVVLRPARYSEDHETQTISQTETKTGTIPTVGPQTNHTETQTQAGHVKTGQTETTKTGRLRTWRDRKVAEAQDRKTRAEETKTAALTAAANRPPAPDPTPTTETETDIAPVPRQLKWLGIWLDRTFGAVPLVSPLLVSGYYTMQVFTDQPINAHPLIALAATCALEGGVWKLARLYEKTLVAGDSTLGLRAGISVYLAIISGLIYWHADHQAKAEGRIDIGWDWLPAAGVAAMSALGVFIWSRTARWQRRRELHAAGRIDKQAPKFAALAWVLTPLETPRALRHAVKFRIDSPVVALEDLRLYVAAGKPPIWPPKKTETRSPETATGTTPETPALVQVETTPVQVETQTIPVQTQTTETQTNSTPVSTPVQTGTDIPDPTPVSTPIPVPTPREIPAVETTNTPGRRDRDHHPVPTNSRTGLRSIGNRNNDAEYIRQVRDHYPDWADPNRSKQVTAREIELATGLRGKATILRIRNGLYAALETETTSTPTETSRDLVGADH